MKFHNIVTILLSLVKVSISLDIPSAFDYLNKFRIMHCVPQLTYNKEIERIANEHAKYIIESGKFEHSINSYGENIAYAYVSGDDNRAFIYTTDLMYAEKQYYDYNNPEFSYTTGHFTQMVWKNSKHVGIGYYKNETVIAFVVNFHPPGNYYNDFIDNVLPSVECKD